MKYQKCKYNKWTKWFAWRPVKTIDSELVWLRWVERKWYSAKVPNVTPGSWIIYRKKSSPK